jgi:hypothetical protein
MEWTDLAQDGKQWRVFMKTVINIRVSHGIGMSGGCVTRRFSGSTQLHEVSYDWRMDSYPSEEALTQFLQPYGCAKSRAPNWLNLSDTEQRM